MMLFFTLLFAVAVFPSFGTVEKVQIGFFYESLCESCHAMFLHRIYPAYKKVGNIVNFTLVPFGNAEEKMENGQWKFTCQHGVQECVGNMYHTCGIHLLRSKPGEDVDFVNCMIKSGAPEQTSFAEAGKTCADQTGIDSSLLSYCVKHGSHLEHLMAQLTPEHDYVPWITLNGKHTETIQNEAMLNLVKLICDNYKGKKPKACRKDHTRCYKKSLSGLM